ncbi:MAG: hypothetical protein Q9180_006797 [Flavoplaca navasiana]
MRSFNSLPALLSLVRASPRLYQVFRDRREYLITQVAFNHFHPQIIDDVWCLAKAIEIPKPIDNPNQVRHVLNLSRYPDDAKLQPSIGLELTVPLCNIGEIIAWFVEDYRRSSLDLLAHVSSEMDLPHDLGILQTSLSPVELGRLQRAFCRFETFCCLSPPPRPGEEVIKWRMHAEQFFSRFEPDEVEEVTCIRDYLIRRLYGIFEAVEEDALQGEQSESIRIIAQEHQPNGWLSNREHSFHHYHMDQLMSQGLKFLRNLFTSEGLKRAELVISNSSGQQEILTAALHDYRHFHLDDNEQDYDDGSFDGEDAFDGDDIDILSQGLLWANKNKVPREYNRRPLKGLRDWGYVFWESNRLKASGILEVEPEDVAIYVFKDWMFPRSDRRSVEARLKEPRWVIAPRAPHPSGPRAQRYSKYQS